jgi:hypothetical protein
MKYQASELRPRRMAALQRQIVRYDRELEEFQRRDNRFFWIRLSTLAAGGLLTFAAFLWGPDALGWGALALLVAVFSTVVFFHRRLDRARARFQVARRWALSQLGRMELDWERIPPPAALPEPDSQGTTGHPFARDLDLTGEHSLHRLLDTAVSTGGSRRLRDWLLHTDPDPLLIQERQEILLELVPRIGFRSRLALSGSLTAGDPERRWNGEALLDWLQRKVPTGSLRLSLLLLTGMAVLNAALFWLALTTGLPPLWILSLGLYAIVYQTRYLVIGETFSEAQFLSVHLERFRAVLVHLERYPFPAGSRLSRLCACFRQGDQRPSSRLRTIAAIASAASLRNNPIVWITLNALMPWDLFFAYRLERYKLTLVELLPVWLDTWYELEALSSLANFAYLNPDYAFPHLTALDAGGPVLSARAIGHPLIPPGERVCNDFELERLGDVVILTGSNMSGKSTFLRTLGINLCLAYAGGPAAARSLRVIPFRVFTSIQVSDSLSYGISYFYAEVRRLKALLTVLQQGAPGAPGALGYPLFFLIDEIFRGTNNMERQIGSRSYVQALAGGYGAGLISTHDLELVHLEDVITGIRNYHFREEVSGDRMVFDYRLREGPSPTTNALKIMELEGLPVRPPDMPTGQP